MFTKLKFRILNLFGAGFLFFVVLAPTGVYAATLYFSPSSGNFSVGDLLNTSVLVNTQNKAINNTDAVINFPSALLEVVSLSKSSSIFTLWVEEPAFSNSAGTISFNGGLPTPGFTGSAGRLLSIIFRVRNPGTASLVFSSGSVRANDGYGTDILQIKSQAQFNLVSEERPVVPSPSLGTPQAPRISSPTHPDLNKWYAKSTATFNWPVPSGVDATRLLVGKISTAEPVVLYVPAISQKTVENLGDGVWYFSAQLRNDSGWGAVGRFRFQIDTEKPEYFDIRLAPREDLTDPKVKFIFDVKDKTSGIDYYEIRINNEESLVWRDDGTHIYETSALPSGKYILLARAIDKAGNSLTNLAEFTIEVLEPPVITEWPRELQSGEQLTVKGITKYPNAQIVVLFQRKNDVVKQQTTKSDEKGNFIFVAEDNPKDGVYELWAEVVDERGARSAPSEKITIIVKRSAFLQIGSKAISFLTVAVPLIALIFLILFIVWYGWHKFHEFRKRLKKEVQEAESALHKSFDLLKEDMREQVKMLEKIKTKRELTEEEEKLIKRLKKHLEDTEKIVEKEIQDIEKVIR